MVPDLTVSLRKLGRMKSSTGKSGIERLSGVEHDQWPVTSMWRRTSLRMLELANPTLSKSQNCVSHVIRTVS